jgi:hypothetical protein
MMTKGVANNCNNEGGKGKWWSTWWSWLGGSWTTTNTKDARQWPPRWKSWWLGWLLVVVAKRDDKEDDDQHEEFD